jgi:hypothetical protein
MGHEHADGFSPMQAPGMTNSLNGAMAAMSMTPDGVRPFYPQQYMVPYGAMMDPHYWNFGAQYPMGLHGAAQKYSGTHAQHGTEDEAMSGISPNTRAIAQGAYPPPWYPQYAPEHAQVAPVPAAPVGQPGHAVPYQLYSPAAMGHYAYPAAALPYSPYPAAGFAYQNSDNSQAQHAVQQAVPPYQYEEDRRHGNSPSNTASRFEEQSPASQ